MPTFYYTAKSQTGKSKSGTIQAKDEHSLAQALRKSGFILTSFQSLEMEQKKQEIDLMGKLKGFLGRVSLMEKLLFTRHLRVMLGAGFPLHKSLETLANQTTNANFRKIINNLVIGIKKGQTLADSLAKYPKVFDNFFVSMIRVGEKGGNLEEILKILAKHLKKEHDFRSKLRGAMVYPTVILIAMVGIGILMMTMVMPKITAMFEELKVDLPITTQILIAISKILSEYFFIGASAFLVLIFILVRLLRSKQGKHFLSWLFLNTPLLKKIIHKVNCARFARGLSSLMESGVAIVESLKITAQTLDNTLYSVSLNIMSEKVKKGKSLQESIEEHKDIYPILVSQMIGVGEQTGELSDIMERLADFYEEEVSNITDNLASIIEPILMIIIGAAVGFFAISMIQPMYSMMQGL